MLLFLSSVAFSQPDSSSPPLPVGTHERHAMEQLGSQAPILRPRPNKSGPESTVYGYVPHWNSDLGSVPYSHLSHIAWFGVTANLDGSLSEADEWLDAAETLVPAAHAAGSKVHLCLISFEPAVHASILATASSRSAVIDELQSLVDAAGADGVNVDFELLEAEWKTEFVSFIQELSAAVDEVYIAVPAIDWSGSFDFDELANASDGLFIMGYDYHWRTGDPGPVAPLQGGDPWGVYALDWSLDDYRTWGAPPDKIIMGLPLYGWEWPASSDSTPGTALSSASAYTMAQAIPRAESYGVRYDSVTDTPWTWTGSSQLWYDDHDSLFLRMDWALSEGIQGIGFWAIGYDGGDPDFWSMVGDLTGAEAGGDDGTSDGEGGSDGEEEEGGDEGQASSDTASPPLSASSAKEEGRGGCSQIASAKPLSFSVLLLSAFCLRRRKEGIIS
jgi:hypothetical protein